VSARKRPLSGLLLKPIHLADAPPRGLRAPLAAPPDEGDIVAYILEQTDARYVALDNFFGLKSENENIWDLRANALLAYKFGIPDRALQSSESLTRYLTGRYVPGFKLTGPSEKARGAPLEWDFDEFSMPKSFKAALALYKETPDLSSYDRAHLQRWADDNRAEEIWQRINRAVQKNKKLMGPTYLIHEILLARRIAMGIGQRGKFREEYRNKADEMERLGKFLRRPHPFGMPSFPAGTELARMLDEAASYFRNQVEITRNIPDVIKFSRKSTPRMVFMGTIGNDLKRITRRWLDQEVAVLTDIAFDSADIIDVRAVRRTRGQPTARA
jgi:hypothetical protein